MADKNRNKGKSKGHQQNGGGGRVGSVTESIKNTEIGRKRNRNESKLREKRRDIERQQGVFHIRVNDGRLTDVFAAIRGEVGSYAYPGGNQPSLHFNVQKEVRKHDVIPVIRFESVQENHELSGEVFDEKVYLPCSYIEQFGKNFKSKMTDMRAVATQELICDYFTHILDEAQEAMFAARESEFQKTAIAQSSSNREAMLREICGQYLVQVKQGNAVFEVDTGNLKVVASTVPGLSASSVFVPVACLFKETLNQVTDDAIYEKQCAIHAFIRTELADVIEKVRTAADTAVEIPLTASGKPMGAKELAKQKKKLAAEIAQLNEQAKKAAALEAMRKAAMSVKTAAMTGRIGYVDMCDETGELIVQYRESGADKIAEVAFIGDNHILRLAKVTVGTKVFVGQILAGKIDGNDFGASKLTKEEVHAKTSLIGFIRNKLEQAHILLPKREPAKLKLAA